MNARASTIEFYRLCSSFNIFSCATIPARSLSKIIVLMLIQVTNFVHTEP